MKTTSTPLTATLQAWLPKDRQLAGLFDADVNAQQIVSACFLINEGPSIEGRPASYWEREGYTHIGSAQVMLTLNSRDALLANKVTSLQARKASVLADAQRTATEIEGEIQKLLAIGYSVGEVAQ